MLQNIKSWWNYQRNAQGKYYLHSPFVYQFYLQILESAPDEKCLAIDKELFKLKQNHSPLQNTSVSQFANQELELKYGKIIYQLLKQSKAQYILDLHSTLGISTAYLASSKHDIVVTTIGEKQDYAKDVHQSLGLKNVDYISFLTDEMLANFPRLDVVFGSAKNAQFFSKFLPYAHSETMFIINDIHANEETERIWNDIKANEKVTLTIDLFKIGLVFFARRIWRKRILF
ncbi:MAG TPA: hypothetical protein VGB95_01925 [Chitinophagales bacterium]